MLLSQCTGYFFTYYNTRITEERKAQIERINEQVQTWLTSYQEVVTTCTDNYQGDLECTEIAVYESSVAFLSSTEVAVSWS